MINIVILFNPFHHNSASANRWLSLIDGLSSQGVIIKIYIYGGYSSVQERIKWKIKSTFNNVKYEYINVSVIEGYWKIRWHNYINHYFLNKKIIGKLIDIVGNQQGIIWTDTSIIGFKFAFKLKKKLPQKIIFTEISEFLDIHKYNNNNLIQRLVGDWRKKYFEKKAFYSYDGIALMTHTLMKHFENLTAPHPRFLHLPMTVDLNRFTGFTHSLPEFQKPYIAFVGVMNDAKEGVSTLIHAFHHITNKFPFHKLYLVGGWNYDTPSHLELINKYELSGKIFWMKEYSRDKIPQIICHADLLVLPRPNSRQAQGGFPTKLGEYLATGNPVCATLVGEIPDYLKENESIFFAKPGSFESFADAMDRALSSYTIAKQIGINGRSVAHKEFNKDIQVKKLISFFNQFKQ